MAFRDSDKDEISSALEEFARLQGEVPSILDQYLNKVAATGITLFPWSKLKPLLTHKLDVVTKEFHSKSPMNILAPRPNVETVTFEELRQRLFDMLQQFNGTPFTIQRLCELLMDPMKHYQRTDKFMRGLEKNLVVVTTVDPFGNRVVHEAKAHTPMVNGLDASGAADPSMSPGAGDSVTNTVRDERVLHSPYIPPAPRNSPATTSSSWFTSRMERANKHPLSTDKDSPSSSPSYAVVDSAGSPWRSASGMHTGDLASPSDDTQLDDNTDPPPRKIARLEPQDSFDHSDSNWSPSYNPLHELLNTSLGDDGPGNDMMARGGGNAFAPILGQLLRSREVENTPPPPPPSTPSRAGGEGLDIGGVNGEVTSKGCEERVITEEGEGSEKNGVDSAEHDGDDSSSVMGAQGTEPVDLPTKSLEGGNGDTGCISDYTSSSCAVAVNSADFLPLTTPLHNIEGSVKSDSITSSVTNMTMSSSSTTNETAPTTSEPPLENIESAGNDQGTASSSSDTVTVISSMQSSMDEKTPINDVCSNTSAVSRSVDDDFSCANTLTLKQSGLSESDSTSQCSTDPSEMRPDSSSTVKQSSGISEGETLDNTEANIAGGCASTGTYDTDMVDGECASEASTGACDTTENNLTAGALNTSMETE